MVVKNVCMPGDFVRQVAALRPHLLRAASRRVRNQAWAEDAVSETILAALERPAAFQGRSQLQTWLMGVLKHKLVDQLRRHACDSGAWAHDEHDAHTQEAAQPGHAAIRWGDPVSMLHEKQVLIQVDACMQTLPQQQAKAFWLRDCMELDTAEVCQELGVSAGNLYVMLYRARRSLRDLVAFA
jgi:RNA polymerase sigma-70 factor (TIGR02943 family)